MMLDFDQTKAIVADEAKRMGGAVTFFEQSTNIGSGRIVTTFHVEHNGKKFEGGGKYTHCSETDARMAVRIAIKFGSAPVLPESESLSKAVGDSIENDLAAVCRRMGL